MKILVAPDSFKGTLSSTEVCEIISSEAKKRLGIETISLPIADGGEGTLDAFEKSLPSARRVASKVKNACMEDVFAPYLYSECDRTAIIEMAKVAGFSSSASPLNTSTYGVGQLISDAISRGATRIIVGLGGSCTNDGGCGMAAALGVKFYSDAAENADDAESTISNGTYGVPICIEGNFIPTGGTLSRISSIDCSDAKVLLKDIEIIGLCDVDNPLCGQTGAAYVFAPQKGATPEQVVLLDNGLYHLARIWSYCASQSGDFSFFSDTDFSLTPGAGAAGGLGFGLLSFAGAKLKRGIDIVIEASNFASHIADSQLVITGEGHFDSQGLNGKVVSGICHAAASVDSAAHSGVPVVVVCGFADDMDPALLESLNIVKVFETGRFSMDRMTCSQAHSLASFQLRETMIDVTRFIESFAL